MRFIPSSIVTLLGVANAAIPRVDLSPSDAAMVSWPMYTPFHGCFKKATEDFEGYKERIRKGKLYGPCHYMMCRSYEGNVKDLLGKKGHASNFTSFVINVQAPKQMTTRITDINFGGDANGSDCSSFRFSRVTEDDKEEPRYFQAHPEGDKAPRYSFWDVNNREGGEYMNYIEGGDYLIELPSTCLTDGSLSVLVTHMYEDVARQLQLIGGSGKLYKNSTQCHLPDDMTRIKSHKQYMKLAKSLSRDCQYDYEREYRWVVPATHLLTEDGKTQIMAQVQLNEPMMADATRMLTRLSLETVSGESCEDAILYSREKMISRGENQLFGFLTSDDGILYADLPWGNLADTSRDFVFVLPEECELTNPVLRMRVVDSNVELSKLAPRA